ncbi:hypothetical protein ZEAMMB73_Zm00001d039587, partial [Zea mays]
MPIAPYEFPIRSFNTHLCVLFQVVAVGDLCAICQEKMIVLGSSSTRCVRQGSSSSAHPWRTSSSSPAIRPGMPSQNGTFNLVLLQRLELSEVMVRSGMNPTVSDQAILLDLIAKSRCVAAAKKYFLDLPETSKTYF